MVDPGRWAEGAVEIESMIQGGELERVIPSRSHAERLLAEAVRHLTSAEAMADLDPPMAYDSLYAAARKSLAAVLAVQGLRATSRGGHLAVQHAIEAQLGRIRHVIKSFSRLRITRNEADYPSEEHPQLTAADIREDLPAAADIVDAMKRLAPRMGPF
jgi:hypothetical protein